MALILQHIYVKCLCQFYKFSMFSSFSSFGTGRDGGRDGVSCQNVFGLPFSGQCFLCAWIVFVLFYAVPCLNKSM